MAYGCQTVGASLAETVVDGAVEGARLAETVVEVADSAVEGARLGSVLAFGEQSGA